MKFSKKSEYGLRALIELTKNYGHPITRQQIGERQNVPVVFVEDEMARPRAHRRPLIQERQRAGRLIDRERTDRSGRLAFEVVDLVHGKQEPPLHIEVDERWIRRLDGQSERHERDVLGDLEILGLQPEEVDTLALAPATCVRADIHERLIQSGPLYH